MKVGCADCRWVGHESDLPKGRHPFRPDASIVGCPNCLELDLYACCDEYACREPVTCGTPMPDGSYRSTCGDHRPRFTSLSAPRSTDFGALK